MLGLIHMNKTLETLLKRAADWPPAAQEAAAVALVDIEERLAEIQALDADERAARLAELRDTLEHSIQRGGSYTDEDIEASIAARLDAWERHHSRP
jgi:hypothetical protein